MSTLLSLILAVTSAYVPQSSLEYLQKNPAINKQIQRVSTLVPIISPDAQSLVGIDWMLHHESPTLNQLVINKVLTTLKCANEYNVERDNILTIIDYSLPSNQKRLWVFDLTAKKLLFNTYVSHGIKSGSLLTDYFSNKNNSKASSIGVYQTQESYYGRDGLSLRLEGLDRSFNDNASSRSVVMHPGWYVDEDFIKKYGRPGRSWGCPALPVDMSQAVINTIKNKSLLVIYYPSDNWFTKSKFLNCDRPPATQYAKKSGTDAPPVVQSDEPRDPILFAAGHGRHDESPVAAISADAYVRVFHTPAPLTRMLRRQINNAEYIALSTAEFNQLINMPITAPDGLNAVYFVSPQIKMIRGYAETQMKIVNLGKIKQVKVNGNSSRENSYTVYFDGRSVVYLSPCTEFVRWVGL